MLDTISKKIQIVVVEKWLNSHINQISTKRDWNLTPRDLAHATVKSRNRTGIGQGWIQGLK